MFASRKLNIPRVLYVFCLGEGAFVQRCCFGFVHVLKIKQQPHKDLLFFQTSWKLHKPVFFLENHRADLFRDLARNWALAQAWCSFDSQCNLAPQRLAGAPCSPAGDVFMLFIVGFDKLFMLLFWKM